MKLTDKALGYLGLMRKAGKLEQGEDRAGEAVGEGRARLVLLASDATENAQKRVLRQLAGRRALLVTLPYTRDDISSITGVSCGVAAVTDFGFAEAFLSALAAEDPLKYGELSAEMKRRADKAARRKAEGPKRKLGRVKHE